MPRFKAILIACIAFSVLSFTFFIGTPNLKTLNIGQENKIFDDQKSIQDLNPEDSLWLSNVSKDIIQKELSFSLQSADSAGNNFTNSKWHFVNRNTNLRSYISKEGWDLEPKDITNTRNWKLNMKLSGISKSEEILSPVFQNITTDNTNNTINLNYDLLVEWYQNSPQGIKQNLTIDNAPAGAGNLEVMFDINSELSLSVSDDKVAFFDSEKSVLEFGNLVVTDANGVNLESNYSFDEAANQLKYRINDSNATYPINIDPLALTPDWTAEADQASADFGRSVASGDVNGDGFDDLLVGAYLFDNGTSNEGAAFLYYGSASGPSLASDWLADSTQSNSNFGYSVALVDVNFDTYSDILVGAYAYDNVQSNEGAAFLWLSSSTGPGTNGDPTNADWSAEANLASSFLGYSVANAGDVNDDTYEDIIIGSYLYNNGQSQEGVALVWYGSSSGLGANGTPANADWLAESNQASAHLGYSVSGAGDVNGDNVDDVIIGADTYDNPEIDEGAAFVYYGSPSGLGVNGTPANADWFSESNQASSNFGHSVSRAGDVNGDTFDDIIIGAHVYTSSLTGEGAAFVWYGSGSGLGTSGTPANADWQAFAVQSNANLGASVSYAGDTNGDGFDEVIVGASGYDNGQSNEGAAFLWYGADIGLGSNGTPANSDWTTEANVANSFFGTSVATGDINGDSYSDVIVGAPGFTNVQSAEGRVFLYLADPPPGFSVNQTAGNTTVVEGGLTDSFSVVLTSQPATDVIIDLSSSDTTAVTIDQAQLTFTNLNWNISQNVNVSAPEDADAVVENVTITASINDALSDDGFDPLTNQTINVNLTDNDLVGINVSAISGNTNELGAQATFTVVLLSQPTNDVTIPVSSSDTIEGTVSTTLLTFTNLNWNFTQTVTVTGQDDFIDDGAITYTIILGNSISSDGTYNNINPDDLTLDNLDNDTAGALVAVQDSITSESGSTGNFTIVLTSEPLSDVTIPLSSDNTNEGTIAITEVVFTNLNWNIAQTITVTGAPDPVPTVDGAVIYHIITGDPTSSDPIYNDLNASDISDATFSNQNTDGFGIIITPIGPSITSETGDSALFRFTLLSYPSGDVTIPISVSDPTEGTLVASTELTIVPADWNNAIVNDLNVWGVDDVLFDGDIDYNLVTGDPFSTDPNYDSLTAADVADPLLTNLDNDTPGITVSSVSGNTSELGAQATFTVILDSQPTSDVTIPISSSNAHEGTVSSANLIFTDSNWDTAQTVTITGQNDYIDDGDIPYSIVIGLTTSSDTNYNNVNPNDLTLSNTDDDTFGITVTPPTGNTNEAGTSTSFSIVLNSEPQFNVSIPISSSDTTEAIVSTSNITFTNLNWNTPQSVIVTGQDDLTDDGDINFTVNLEPTVSTDANYNNIDLVNINLVNLDNDDPAQPPSTNQSSQNSNNVGSAGVNLQNELLSSEALENKEVNATVSTGSDSENQPNKATTGEQLQNPVDTSGQSNSEDSGFKLKLSWLKIPSLLLLILIAIIFALKSLGSRDQNR